ncbi:MAG: flagellar basal body P-ring formation chaperone FlgA [Brevundimonas sp.]
MRALAVFLAAFALATPALADPVTLRDQPTDDDGRVTLGDLFDNAGAASNVFVASRTGPTLVLEAGALQSRARQAGLTWSNPQGLRRVVVREGAGAPAAVTSTAPAAARPGATVEVLTYTRSLAAGDIVQPEDVAWTTVQAHMAPAGGPQDAEGVIGLSARRPLRAGATVASRDLTAPQVIARNDMVQVSFVSGGVTLTVTGRATRDAALGEAVPIINTSSGRTIDAVAAGPGRAIAGPAALQARVAPNQFASR